jgi:hypothetical protein
MGYTFFYACGSPFDQAADKPAICQSIDAIKLDIYAAYQSDFYKSNLDPYIAPATAKANEIYWTYGIPTQTTLINLYQQHGKPVIDSGWLQAKHAYDTKIIPAATPYLENAKNNVQNVKDNYYVVKYKLVSHYDEAAVKVQAFIKDQYEHMPPSVIQVQESMLYWIDRAENTDLLPILTKYYHLFIEFCYYHYRYHYVPLSNQITEQTKQRYGEYIKPLLIQYSNQFDQALDHARTLLKEKRVPPRSLTKQKTVASTIAEIKTPTTTTKTLEDIPISTGTATVALPHQETLVSIVDKAKEAVASVKDKIKESIPIDTVKEAAAAASEKAKKASVAASEKVSKTVAVDDDDQVKQTANAGIFAEKVKDAASSAINILKDSQDTASKSVNKAKEAASEAYVSYVAPVVETLAMANATTSTTTASAKATVGHTATNKDEDIVHKPATASVTPLNTPVFEEVPIPPPDANKKEAIYCPTCNPQEEQLIIAPTDKHVEALPEEHKEVFEVHKQPVGAAPQSPNHADYLKKDIQAIADEKELFKVHKEPIAATPSPAVQKEEEKEESQGTTVLEAVVGKTNVKIPIVTETEAPPKDDDIIPNDESQFDHDEYKESPVHQEVFVAVEKEEPSVVAEQPTIIAVVTEEEEEPVVPDDQSEFVATAEKENIVVDGSHAEESKEVPEKVEENASV